MIISDHSCIDTLKFAPAINYAADDSSRIVHALILYKDILNHTASGDHIGTTVWLHDLDSNKMLGEKA